MWGSGSKSGAEPPSTGARLHHDGQDQRIWAKLSLQARGQSTGTPSDYGGVNLNARLWLKGRGSYLG